MELSLLTSILNEAGASEREIETATYVYKQKSTQEEKDAFAEEMKQKFVTGVNKGNPPTVKTTKAAAEVAKESGIDITAVKAADKVVSVSDVQKAASDTKE